MLHLVGIVVFGGLVIQCDNPNYPSYTDLNYEIEILDQSLFGGLQDVFFINESTGYVVSGNGYIEKTVDGGQSWTQQSSGTTKSLQKIFFLTADVGFVAGGCNGTSCGGAESIILKTTDGGTSWIQLDVPTKLQIRSIFFLNEQTGFASMLGKFISTEDGGVTWSVHEYPGPTVGPVCFVNESMGYVKIPSGGRLISLDGGKSWSEDNQNEEKILSQYLNSLSGNEKPNYTCIYYILNGTDIRSKLDDQRNVFDAHFIDEYRGFAVGWGNWNVGGFGKNFGYWNGAIHTTFDTGVSWESDMNITSMSGIYGIHFPNSRIGFAVGGGRYILKLTILD